VEGAGRRTGLAAAPDERDLLEAGQRRKVVGRESDDPELVGAAADDAVRCRRP
jgi:hypothetical protein